jgi:hypothetical protein
MKLITPKTVNIKFTEKDIRNLTKELDQLSDLFYKNNNAKIEDFTEEYSTLDYLMGILNCAIEE